MGVENPGFLHGGISPLLAMSKVVVRLSLSILAASTVVVLLSLSIPALRDCVLLRWCVSAGYRWSRHQFVELRL